VNMVIISSSPDGKVARRILESAVGHGLQARIVGVDDIGSLFAEDLNGTVILPRISPEKNAATTQLLQIQAAGGRVINSAESWAISRDKWSTYQSLERAHVPTPQTIIAPAGSLFSLAFGLGEQAVFKPRYGTHGEGIVVLQMGDVVPAEAGVLQKYVETGGTDIRLFVVGSRVVAAMHRQAKPGDFRANLHQGATAMAYLPSKEMQQLAVRAAKSMGLDVAGIDILANDTTMLVIEANPSPGFGIEKYTGSDIAGAIIEAILTKQV